MGRQPCSLQLSSARRLPALRVACPLGQEVLARPGVKVSVSDRVSLGAKLVTRILFSTFKMGEGKVTELWVPSQRLLATTPLMPTPNMKN